MPCILIVFVVTLFMCNSRALIEQFLWTVTGKPRTVLGGVIGQQMLFLVLW